MRIDRVHIAWLFALVFGGVLSWSQPAPLVLAGGTVVDVTDWGRSANDLRDSVVIVREGKIAEVGPRSAITIPKGARILDCTGKYIIPGLIDGFAGMSGQGEASANLYMGVTTVVASSDAQRGHVDLHANPSPHIYLLDSIGTADDWSLLIGQPAWKDLLREGPRPVELSPQDTQRQLADTARLGTRVLWLGPNITAANTQWIITHAHQMGLVTYAQFAATPYRVGIEAGVDALLHMGRYELGLIPDELQRPLVDDPIGAAAMTALDYSQRLPPADAHVRTYAELLASHRVALMPTFSMYYQRLPGHRNLWQEPAAALLDPARMYNPPNQATGEMEYPLSPWAHRLPASAQRWMEENQRRKADQSAMRLWRINQVFFSASPHYLAATGAPVSGSFPGISMHTELEMLVRLGLSPREALAAATGNYAQQFNWNELGLIAPGRRADILVLDGDPTVTVWNVRRILNLIVDGNVLDRDALLNPKR